MHKITLTIQVEANATDVFRSEILNTMLQYSGQPGISIKLTDQFGGAYPQGFPYENDLQDEDQGVEAGNESQLREAVARAEQQEKQESGSKKKVRRQGKLEARRKYILDNFEEELLALEASEIRTNKALFAYYVGSKAQSELAEEFGLHYTTIARARRIFEDRLLAKPQTPPTQPAATEGAEEGSETDDESGQPQELELGIPWERLDVTFLKNLVEHLNNGCTYKGIIAASLIEGIPARTLRNKFRKAPPTEAIITSIKKDLMTKGSINLRESKHDKEICSYSRKSLARVQKELGGFPNLRSLAKAC